MVIRMAGVPVTRENKPRHVGFGDLKYVTECERFVGFGDSRRDSFDAWKEMRDNAIKEQACSQSV